MTGGGNGGLNMYKYHYPKSRTTLAKDNVPMGVVGSVELLVRIFLRTSFQILIFAIVICRTPR
jgi:hypothetical protein